ncbi:universal stress protein [Desemzia sp. FAM 23991]|uniref:universal stress protein n=1 Tax=unclassified Desemzia TaxID=2685243 RepID=UPI0038849051
MAKDIQEYKRIMVAVDGSASAEYAYKKAVKIAVRNHSDLVIAHVVDTRTYSMGMPALYTEGIITESDDMKDQLAGYKSEAEAHGVTNVTIEMAKGHPRTLLAEDIPKRYEVDLIIVGQTGLNAVERWMIGSVSEHILRTAPCDVLIVKNELENEE